MRQSKQYKSDPCYEEAVESFIKTQNFYILPEYKAYVLSITSLRYDDTQAVGNK